MIKWHEAIPKAPMIKVGFRPQLSTYRTAGIVAMNIAIPTTPVASSETAFEDRPRSPKIVGA